ncbi:MAG: hypothetical protein Q9208_001219 [Pyrenodesmia sp. 3 TL-2023]
MDPHTDPQAKGAYSPKNIVRTTGETPSGMSWTTYSGPFGEHTFTQEEAPKAEMDTEPLRATEASRTYSHPHLGKVIFTAEEQDALYREAATTLPKAKVPLKATASSPLIPVIQKLRDLEPTWYRHSPDGPQVFIWLAIARKGHYRNGFYDPELNDELFREMAPRIIEVETREALKKLELPVGSDRGLGFRRGKDVRE